MGRTVLRWGTRVGNREGDVSLGSGGPSAKGWGCNKAEICGCETLGLGQLQLFKSLLSLTPSSICLLCPSPAFLNLRVRTVLCSVWSALITHLSSRSVESRPRCILGQFRLASSQGGMFSCLCLFRMRVPHTHRQAVTLPLVQCVCRCLQ